jgi:hypothetical protein
MEAHLSERGKKQVRPRQAPDHRTFGAGSDAGGAKSCRRTIHRARSATGEFVQGAICKATAWQDRIDFRHAEGKTAGLSGRHALQRGDALAQIENHLFAGSSHRSGLHLRSRWWPTSCQPKCGCSVFVPFEMKSQATGGWEYYPEQDDRR